MKVKSSLLSNETCCLQATAVLEATELRKFGTAELEKFLFTSISPILPHLTVSKRWRRSKTTHPPSLDLDLLEMPCCFPYILLHHGFYSWTN